MDDVPPKDPLETTDKLSAGFISEYAVQYEHLARASKYPPKAAIEKAYAALTQQDDPDLYATEEEVDDHAETAELDATNCLITEVTSVDYQMPRRLRCRMPSGPYRILSDSEKDTIMM